MKKAFTLAEVLITLGIMGVVAALIIPNFLGKYRQSVVESRLKKFYSIANQAIKMSEVENGPKEHWAVCDNSIGNQVIDCQLWFDIYLKKYLNPIKVEQLKLGAYNNNIAATFNDGSMMIIKQGYDIFFYPNAKDFVLDKFLVSSPYSRPDLGKKFFAFQFIPISKTTNVDAGKNKGIEPYRATRCVYQTDEDGEKQLVCNELSRDEYLNNSTYGCNENAAMRVYCTALIQENGWKIPKDYPFKF